MCIISTAILNNLYVIFIILLSFVYIFVGTKGGIISCFATNKGCPNLIACGSYPF